MWIIFWRCQSIFRDDAAFEGVQISSYSYTAEETKRKSLVLRELFCDTDIADIKKEIDFICPNTIDSVTKFTTVFF